MKRSTKKLEFKLERTIPAPPEEVYDAWLNPQVPGTPWNFAEKLIFHAGIDGFFYWSAQGTAHYGRFTDTERPTRIQHTWVSPNTLGEESTVTVTLAKQGEGTLMTLHHADLPDTEAAEGHEAGWNYFFETFPNQFRSDGAER